jgi:hypothetical protein
MKDDQAESPKCVWDHCLELEEYVHSCTSNYIYMTAGQVPETIMTGSTANISHIALSLAGTTGLCFMSTNPLTLVTSLSWGIT